MYEARQNKEKVSRRIDKKKKINNNTMTFNTAQRYFDASGYHYAADCWHKAAERADALNERLDLREQRGDRYVDELKTNLELKANKASTTLVGEAYEVYQWNQPKGTSIVIGPGGSSGADLLLYESLKYGDRASTPTEYGEVKSASNHDSFCSALHNAYIKRRQSHIIMYYPVDQELLPDQHVFQREGVNYIICHRKYPEGEFEGIIYTYVAEVVLPDFNNKKQYLYTWVPTC